MHHEISSTSIDQILRTDMSMGHDMSAHEMQESGTWKGLLINPWLIFSSLFDFHEDFPSAEYPYIAIGL